MEGIKNLVINWNLKTNERQKLQHVYLIITVIGTLIAGMMALVNPELGHNLVLVALFAILAFLANAIVWNLLKSVLISNLPSRSPRRKQN